MLNQLKIILHNTKQHKWLLLLMIVHVGIAFYFIAQQNITYDEPSYIEYSKRWLHGNPNRIEALDDSKTPVISFVWLPRIVKQIITPNYQLNDFGRQDQKDGRYMMILVSLLIMLYIYRFALLLKLRHGWFILFFYIFDPLITAYAVLINSDLLSGFLLLAIVFHLFKFYQKKQFRQFFIAAILMGVALVTKHTFLFGLPLFIMAIFYATPKFYLKYFFSTVGILLFVINLAFYFHESFLPLANYHFKSKVFIELQSTFSWLPIPVPSSYLQSIDLLQYHAQLGGSINNTYTGVYLLQQVNLNNGFWYYYFVVALYKIPLSIWGLTIIGLAFFIRRFQQYKKLFFFLVVPAIYFVFVLSFFNQFQIGIRHLLLVVPLLYVLLAMVLQRIALTKAKYVLITFWIFVMASFLKYYPDLIPYTNELLVDKTKVYETMMDSSIDYGQSDSTVALFLRTNINYKIPDSTPASGTYIVSMYQYVEQLKRGDTSLNWLIKKHAPVGLLKHVYLKYDVK